MPGRDQIQPGLLTNRAELFVGAESLLDGSPFPLPDRFPQGDVCEARQWTTRAQVYGFYFKKTFIKFSFIKLQINI